MRTKEQLELQQKFHDRLHETYPHLAQTTLNNYSFQLYRISQLLCIPFHKDTSILHLHQKELVDVIDTLGFNSIRTKDSVASVLDIWTKCISDCPNKFNPIYNKNTLNESRCRCRDCSLRKLFCDIFHECKEIYYKQVKEHIPSEKMKNNLITLDEAKHVLSKVKHSKNLNHILLVALYVEQPALRNDFAGMKIINLKQSKRLDLSKGNYLLVKSKDMKFILNDFKNFDSQGTQEIQVKKPLQKIIRRYLKNHNSEFLLLNSRGNPMTRNLLTQHLIKIFQTHTGKNVGSTMLRHAWATDNIPPEEAKKKEQLASDMCHSIGTHHGYSVSV